MRCVKCGQELPDDANFCRRCGSPTIRNMSYLVQKARENDQEALAEIYKISSPAVYKTIWVLIKDEDTVYDILQDTYVKAFTRLDQLQNPDKLIPWLKMIANNLAKDWLKKSKPVFFTDIYGGEELEDIPFEESIEDVRSELNPEMAMDQQEAKRLVMEILDHLPEDQRVVIGMFYYEEMSVKDIAQTLGVSENTVKSRLSYGRRKIKEQVLDLEKRGTKLYSVAPFVFDPAAPGPGLPIPAGLPVDPSYPVGPVELRPVCPELSAPPDNLLFGFLLLFPQLLPAAPA